MPLDGPQTLVKAVKQPWRRSNRFKALQQMLYINQRNDKLSAARVDFTRRGVLEPPKRSCQSAAVEKALAARALDLDDSNDGGPVDGHGIIAQVQLAPTLSCKFSTLLTHVQMAD